MKVAVRLNYSEDSRFCRKGPRHVEADCLLRDID